MFGFHRIALCVPVIRVADVSGNLEHITGLARKAAQDQASVIVFPELSLTSASCGDLFFQERLLDAAENAAQTFLRLSAELKSVIVLGAPVRCRSRLYDCALVFAEGKLLGIVPKTHQTEHLELSARHCFASGANCSGLCINYAGQRDVPFGIDLIFESGDTLTFGVELGADLWSTVPPGSLLALNGANLILNLSADKELVGKSRRRTELVREQSARCMAAYAYVSSGVHESTTDSVCSGHCLVSENGRMLLNSERFAREDMLYTADVDLARLAGERLNSSFGENGPCSGTFRRITLSELPELHDLRREFARMPFVPEDEAERRTNCQEILAIQSAALAKRLEHSRAKGLVIGISGGLDSTLALLVCAETMKLLKRPASQITTVTMPGFGTTGRTYNNAVKLCQDLGTVLREISIKEACLEHFRSIGHDPENRNVVYENTQARERTQILMDIANQEGSLVVGTGDLSEEAMGWCTYSGDHISMYAVNCSVPKTLIPYIIEEAGKQYSEAVQAVLNDVIHTPVSPELLPANADGSIQQKTEDLIGPYEIHDFFLYHFFSYGASPEKLLFLAEKVFGKDYSKVQLTSFLKTFLRRFFTQQFKRSCATDGPKVGTVSLSPRGDWQMPSDASFEEFLAK